MAFVDRPIGGKDYPRTLQEFDEFFSSDEACAEYVRRVRWPEGFRCPACHGASAWTMARGQLWCAACKRQTSPTAGTIFEGTRKPLRMWFQTIWFVTNQRLGGSALSLQRLLGLGSYQTAWAWLHKIRRAMVRPGRDRLKGRVEVDETYVGGPQPGVSRKQTPTNSIVVIAAEQDGHGIGRIRMRRLRDVSAHSLIPFVQEVVLPGATVHTDGWLGYGGLAAKGYRHKVTHLHRTQKLAQELLPRVHRVAALLQTWILGTHQGSVSDKHLDYYLDEFTFRFNRRRSRAPGLLFYRLLQQAVHIAPVSYRQIVSADSAAHKSRR